MYKNKQVLSYPDVAWKKALDEFLPHALALCFPAAYAIINWEKPWQSLEQELIQILPKRAKNKRVVDKLYCVRDHKDEKKLLLLHLDVQGKKEDAFAERMYMYHYRIFDKYKQHPISCAILIDDNVKWRPKCYEHNMAGCVLSFEFLSEKLLDWVNKKETLEESDNPFASVLLAQLETLQSDRSVPEVCLATKLAVAKRLIKKNYAPESIRGLLAFLDLLLCLPDSTEIEYKRNLLKEERGMKFVTTMERIEADFEAEGLRKGRQEGRQEGEAFIVIELIKAKFNKIPKDKLEYLRSAPQEELLKIGKRVVKSDKLQDIF